MLMSQVFEPIHFFKKRVQKSPSALLNFVFSKRRTHALMIKTSNDVLNHKEISMHF
jgi:hypothetical protein